MDMKAETGVSQPEAKDLQPWEHGAHKEGLSLTPLREASIWDCLPPELREDKFLLFQTTQFVVICYSCSRK